MAGIKKPRKQARQTKKAQLISEYKKELRNLKARIKGYEKRGYYLEKDVIPSQPKRITQGSIEKIRKIRGADLLKQAKASYIDTSTGELISVTEHKKQVSTQRKLSTLSKRLPSVEQIEQQVQQINLEELQNIQPLEQPKYEDNIPSVVDIILRNFEETLNKFAVAGSTNFANRIQNWYDTLLSKYGRDNTAIMIQQGEQAGYILSVEVVYREEEAINYMTEMLHFMPEVGEEFAKYEMEEMGEDYTL